MITVQQKQWVPDSGWGSAGIDNLKGLAQLVMVFGSGELVNKVNIFETIKEMYPGADILMCSTAGEILDTKVSDGTISLTAIAFEHTKVQGVMLPILTPQESEKVGSELGSQLAPENLKHVMVFSDGLRVNGTALVSGLSKNLPKTVSVTGGLVGDGDRFKHTYVGFNTQAEEGKIVCLGFYSEQLRVGYGSMGGWDVFGPERILTKSKGNVLYEVDGKPALDLYKLYLGDKAKDLPSSGLLFPLSLRIQNGSSTVEVVRTLLAVNEEDRSMTFAGDVPEGTPAKLMKANFDRLIDGASGAASLGLDAINDQPELAILISCIGRKLVLRERIEEELEAIADKLGKVPMCGFYSYGEICPTAPTEKQCQLHNQTMTITVMKE